jgi:hypothetical protein
LVDRATESEVPSNGMEHTFKVEDEEEAEVEIE